MSGQDVTDTEVYEDAKRRVFDMYYAAQAGVDAGKSMDEIAGEHFPAGEVEQLVHARDLKELGVVEMPNGARVWVYRHRTDDKCFILGIARRSVLRQRGACLLTAYIQDPAN